MARTKINPPPTNPPIPSPSYRPKPRHHPRSRNNSTSSNALRPASDKSTTVPDIPFITIDYFIALAHELAKFFKAAFPAIWNWILAYSMFAIAHMFWVYKQDDWL